MPVPRPRIEPLAPLPEPRPPAPAGAPARESARDRRRRAREARAKIPTVGTPQPEGLCVDRDLRAAPLANLFWGAHVFLVLSGPSLNELDLAALDRRRGIVTFAVNNAGTVLRPTLWTHVDPVQKFHAAIWDDPGILKFTPTRCFGGLMRRQDPDTGMPQITEEATKNKPGVIGYQRHGTFTPAQFLAEPEVCWGNCKRAAAKNGYPHVLNVMFAVFRLSYYLGFRTINLLGCDFRMEPERIYCFQEHKHLGAVNSNNGTYLKLNHMFGLLAPYFDKAGLEVYNCNPKSGFRVFPYRPFQECVDAATERIPARISTVGWYDKADKDRSGE